MNKLDKIVIQVKEKWTKFEQEGYKDMIIAKHLNLSRANLSYVKKQLYSNKNVTLETLGKLCDYFKIR